MYSSLCLSPCCYFMAAKYEDGSVKLFRLPDRDQMWSVKVHDSLPSSWAVSWSPDSKLIASGSGWMINGKLVASGSSDDYTIKVISRCTGVILMSIAGHTSCVSTVRPSFKNSTGIISPRVNTVQVWWKIFKKQDSQVASFVSSSLSFFAFDMDFYDVLIELHSFLNPLMVDSFIS